MAGNFFAPRAVGRYTDLNSVVVPFVFSDDTLRKRTDWESELLNLLAESRIRRRSQLHLQAVHTLLMPAAEAVALRCRPVRETPIYDQLRDEGINAEVAPSQTAPSLGGRPRRHRRLADTTDAVPVCALPGPAVDPVAHQHPVPERADQPAGATQRTAAVRGPRTTLSRPTHARQTRAHGERTSTK